MGFAFREKEQIEICGKMYPCDTSDICMMESIRNEWPEIVRKLLEAQVYQQQYEAMRAEAQSPQAKQSGDNAPAADKQEEMTRMADELLKMNKDVIESCVNFIHGTVGPEEYEEIFAGRRVNLIDHIDLCAHIYKWAVEGREAALDEYLVPEPTEGQEEGGGAHAAADATN